MEEIELPQTVTTIESQAFKFSGLDTAVYHGTKEPTICKVNAFDSTNITEIIVNDDYEGDSFCGEKIRHMSGSMLMNVLLLALLVVLML